MDKPRRSSGGRSAGRGSDRNSKDSFSKPARGAAPRGKSDGKFDKKPFDKGDKKPYGKAGDSDSRKPAGKPYGDKKFGKSDERPAKPYGDKGKFGDKKFERSDRPAKPHGDKGKFGDKKFDGGDRPSKPYGDKKFDRGDRPAKPYGDKGKFGDKKFADKPGRETDKKSSYKSYEEKGKQSARSDFDPAKFWNDEKPAPKEVTPKKAKTGKDLTELVEKRAKDHEILGEAKKTGTERNKKPRIKRETKPKADIPEYEKSAFPQLGIRLNKFIANSGMCSRREADVMIQNGVVMVNGQVMDELGYRVKADDVVKFDGRTIIPEKPVYLLLNKPKDYITTSEDPQGRKTVMALIQGACKERLFPVGRLDRNTTGLLLFTNDGEMADKLMHPRKRVKKIYLAELDKNMKHEHLLELREGITLEDGPIKPDEVEYAEDKRTIGVEIHSGRNRIVRRMFEHFGYKVVKLDRTYYAGLTKKNLPRGHYRMLEPIEVNMLKML